MKQSETICNNFKDHEKADADVQALLSSGDQIDRFGDHLHLDATTTCKGAKVQPGLAQLGAAHNILVSDGNHAVNNQGTDSCLKAIGADPANKLVATVAAGVAATHPPFNTQNSCAWIRDEIKPGCGILTGNDPKFCVGGHW